jgi:hypothetical protein
LRYLTVWNVGCILNGYFHECVVNEQSHAKTAMSTTVCDVAQF